MFIIVAKLSFYFGNKSMRLVYFQKWGVFGNCFYKIIMIIKYLKECYAAVCKKSPVRDKLSNRTLTMKGWCISLSMNRILHSYDLFSRCSALTCLRVKASR